MQKLFFLVCLVFQINFVFAQPIEVRADYNAVGDVDFVAYNNTKAPLFVYIILGDLENTYYSENLPIVKRTEPGFNALFTLEKNIGSEGQVRFHYEIKYYKSNPVGEVNLDFPYLVPFEEGTKVTSVSVKDIDGFMGNLTPKSWSANGFKASGGEIVTAARNGIIVEITGAKRASNNVLNYNGWNNVVTILQPDGTLACYRNVSVPSKKWKVGDKIYAGQTLGEIAQGASELDFMVYSEDLNSNEIKFIVPEFVISTDKTDLILSDTEINVIHPIEIRGLEMDKKERRKYLK